MGYAITLKEITEILAENFQKPRTPYETASLIMDKIKEKDSCYGKVREGEPIFVLRGQDMAAPALVEIWALRVGDAYQRKSGQMQNTTKVNAAYEFAKIMREWQSKNGCKVPD